MENGEGFMRWVVYNIIFAVVYVAMLPRFLWRMQRRGGYRNRFADRFGYYPDDVSDKLRVMSDPFWIHAVSVGEVMVAGQVMREIREQMPGVRFVLSTTSSTGWKIAEQQVVEGDVLIYNPLDFLPCVRRAVSQIRPRAYILTESEIWPNVIRSCHREGVPLFLVNARISDRSAPGYRRLRFWFGSVLRLFRVIMAQSEEDRRRLLAAGADSARIVVTGSVKFDVAVRDSVREREVAEFLEQCGCGSDKLVLLGGSTWPGEEQVLIESYTELRGEYPELRLVIVPRHFEKADIVVDAVERAGLSCIRKSSFTPGQRVARDGSVVVVGDTTGELMGFYARAAIAFVGKSLFEHGGQNMIEPCLCGAATLVGPHTENFRPVMSDLLEAGAVIQVADSRELQQEIARLVRDAGARRELGERGVAGVVRRRGVLARSVAALLEGVEEESGATKGNMQYFR